LPPEILLWHWFAFGALVVVLLVLDLCVFHKHDHVPSLKESVGWTIFWYTLALIFNGFVWWWQGSEAGQQFLAGYLLEKMLSMDNIFVFVVIFRFFAVPRQYQYRVLFWGILGAIFLRLVFILGGVQLIKHFEWVMPLFGLFLVYTAFKLAIAGDAEVHPESNLVLRVARRLVHVSRGNHEQHGHKFFVHENGVRCLTPLFLVLLVIESTDVLFAVDSIPAIFGISRDQFIIFTSNIFAILGLRALYFLLAGVMEMFRYLHYGLAGVLGFIGVDMVVEYAAVEWLGHNPEEKLVPTWGKLVIIVVVIGISVIVSVIANRREAKQKERDQPK